MRTSRLYVSAGQSRHAFWSGLSRNFQSVDERALGAQEPQSKVREKESLSARQAIPKTGGKAHAIPRRPVSQNPMTLKQAIQKKKVLTDETYIQNRLASTIPESDQRDFIPFARPALRTSIRDFSVVTTLRSSNSATSLAIATHNIQRPQMGHAARRGHSRSR